MSSAIVQTGPSLPAFDEVIGGIVDADTAREAVDGAEKLKKLLEVADQYGAYASKFCRMEAEMYLRISRIPGAEAGLTKARRELVSWLRSKEPGQLDEVLGECDEGRRVHLVMHRELRDKQRASRERAERDAIEEEYSRIQGLITSELANKGKTTLSTSRFVEEWGLPFAPNGDTVKAYVESTRDKLLHANGRGLGDGNGTYLLPEACDRRELAEMVGTRLRSIVADIRQLDAICRENQFRVPSRGIDIIREAISGLEYERA